MRKKEWKVKSSKVVYKSKWLILRQDEVITTDGNNATYDIVERRDIALVIPQVDDIFYMVEQYRYPINAFSLEFPQGFCEDGEDIHQTALRELEEETELKAKKLIFLNTFWVSVGFLRQKCTVFLAKDFLSGKQKLENTEKGLNVKKFTFEDISKKDS